MIVTLRAEVVAPTERAGYVAVEIGGRVADLVGQLMAVRFHELVLLVFVLELGESGFDVVVADQIPVALLVAGVVGRKSIGAACGRLVRRWSVYLGGLTADEGRRKDDDIERDQRRSGQDA